MAKLKASEHPENPHGQMKVENLQISNFKNSILKTLSWLAANIFVLKKVVCVLCLMHIYSNALQTRIFHGSNSINPDQTDLGPYCLQYRLPTL